MESVPIYTIGYGKRRMEEFIKLLKDNEISYLIDVRSSPYSRYKPEFSKEALAMRLKQSGVRYVFMGDTLGGRPDDSTCYVDGQVDYTKVRERPFYRQGIDRIRTAWEKQLRVALMCSEGKPYECHRGKLIGNTLREQGIDVNHIDEEGKIMKQQDINRQLADKPSEQLSLLGEDPSWLLNEKISRSRKKYTPKGEQV